MAALILSCPSQHCQAAIETPISMKGLLQRHNQNQSQPSSTNSISEKQMLSKSFSPAFQPKSKAFLLNTQPRIIKSCWLQKTFWIISPTIYLTYSLLTWSKMTPAGSEKENPLRMSGNSRTNFRSPELEAQPGSCTHPRHRSWKSLWDGEEAALEADFLQCSPMPEGRKFHCFHVTFPERISSFNKAVGAAMVEL